MAKKIKSVEDRLRDSQDNVDTKEKEWLVQREILTEYLQNNTLSEPMVLSMQEEPTKAVEMIISLVGEINLDSNLDYNTKKGLTFRLEEIKNNI